ncbi:MAG: hypothetical protein LBT39_09370 [Treponema sp.]|jgi:hypothetical protein|nr:hypothetical protein [Treponema sp.]
MNYRVLVLLFFAPLVLNAQTPPTDLVEELPAPFPLTLVLEAAYGNTAGRWRPDWPLDIPPDAFALPGAAITLIRDTGESYCLARDSRGRLTDFPVVLPVGLAQVTASYHAGGGITNFTLQVPAEDAAAGITWTAQFPLPYVPGEGTPPAKPEEAVKVQNDAQIFYVLFSEGGAEIAETWFDPWGAFAAYFSTRIERRTGEPWRILSLKDRDYRYENGGNLSQSSGDGGLFSAVYSAQGRPLYWVRAPASEDTPETRYYSFQWDEQGLLVRLRDMTPAPLESADIVISPGEAVETAVEAVEPPPVDFRYEYEFDRRGNWILRREIALVRQDRLLIPAYSREIRRQITLGD